MFTAVKVWFTVVYILPTTTFIYSFGKFMFQSQVLIYGLCSGIITCQCNICLLKRMYVLFERLPHMPMSSQKAFFDQCSFDAFVLLNFEHHI